jgi:uncharacterized protein DUF4288
MTQRKADQVPFRNRSPYGWWIATYLERFEYDDENKRNSGRRCLAWENTVLIRAKTRGQAYRKAVAVGRRADGMEGWHSETKRRGRWLFEGLTDLLPIYERLEHGSEILWKVHENRTVRSIKCLISRKEDLAVFDDRPLSRRGDRRVVR